MMLLLVLAAPLAIALDLVLGDPRSRYHPTAWIGTLVARLAPSARSENQRSERLGGAGLVVSVTAIAGILSFAAYGAIVYAGELEQGAAKILVLALSVLATAVLLKTTIAIRGMEKHTSRIMECLARDDLEAARANLSMIVKRNTRNLDRQHVISATLESISENIVDGITGPLFYFAFFGLAGAFVYRTVNTADSMIGYKTDLFRNLGWFAAKCDTVLNFVPARLTSLLMVLAGMIVGCNWRHSVEVMRRDGPKTESPNAGYPMATMAGALGVRFEKLDNYVLGDGSCEFCEAHFAKAIAMMKVTAVLFVGLFTVPVIIALSYLGWWGLA
ncbi:MAG TPA: cobalamin biosynthesis protein [Candidatus Nitrosotalea sp.]|nr:cobalamin biosynthesis protein [Candidatus Nitrosotalea sp.]